MYKHASRNLQRRSARMAEVRPDASAYIADDDLIPSAANLTQEECLEERRQLLTEKARIENELICAKRDRDRQRVAAIGARLQTLGARLSMIKARLHHFDRLSAAETLAQAVRDVVPEEMRQRIYARQAELRAERGAA